MRTKQIDMVSGPLIRNIFRFSVPIMLADLLEVFFNSADAMIVGRFSGASSLAAVGAASPALVLFTWSLSGLALGANVLAAQLIGEGKKDQIEKAVHTAMWIAAVCGTLVSCFGVLAAPVILKWMGVPPDIMSLSALYMRIYFLCCLPIAVFSFGAALMRASGNSRTPTVYLGISGALNVILNMFFVIVLHMDVAGVAIASVISQTLSAVLIVASLLKDEGSLRLEPSRLRCEKNCAKEIFRIGVPSALQNSLFMFTNIAVQTSINSFGTTAVAANSAANAVEEYVYIALEGFAQASVTFTGQNAGAGNYSRIRHILITTALFAGIFGALIGCGGYAGGPFFLSFFTTEKEVMETGMIRLAIVTRFLFLNGVMDCFVASIRGMGYSLLPTVITMTGIMGFRILYIMTWFQSHHTLDTLYLCFPLSWLITLAAQAVLWIIVYRKITHHA